MNSKIIKFVTLTAFIAGCFSISAQNIKKSSAFAIDKNIISFEVGNLVDKRICEYPSEPGYGGPNSFSPHFWTISLIMTEGTDITSLAPIITMASGVKIVSIETSTPGVSISPEHSGALDFSHQVEYTVIEEDGSIVRYIFLANADGKTRGYNVTIYSSPFNGGSTLPYGTLNNVNSVNITATPNYPSYVFDKWLVTEYWFPGSIGSTITHYGSILIMPIVYDTDITAVFKPATQYTVTPQSEDTNKGTVTGGGTCYSGGTVVVSAYPKPGYLFDGWYLNGSKVSSLETHIYFPSASCTLIAKFITEYTVTVQSEDTNKGTVAGGGTCLPGGSVVAFAYPKSGYKFDGWYLNGAYISRLETYIYIPSASCTLIAKFLTQYTVTVQSEDTNKGTVAGGGTCISGGYVSVSASPNSGYTFDGWYLNGSKISGSTPYNFFASATCTIIAKFNPLPPVITGPYLICNGSSHNYSVSGAPPGFTWSNSANLTLTGSGTTVSVTATAVGPGSVSIKNNLGVTVASWGITVTEPRILDANTHVSGQPSIFYAINDCFTPTSYFWSVYPSDFYSTYSLTPFGNYASVIFNNPGSYTVMVTMVGGAVNFVTCSTIANVGRGGGTVSPFTIYPNPVNDILYIDVDQQAIIDSQSTGSSVNKNPICEFRLYSMTGAMVLQTTSGNSRVQLNVSSFPNGMYYLHLYDNVTSGNPEIKAVIIKH